MSPPTNGAVSLAYQQPLVVGSGAGGLQDALLLPFHGFTDEDLLLAADAALLGAEAGAGAAADQTLLLLPSSSDANGCGGGGGGISSAEAYALPAPASSPEFASTAADAASLSRSREPAPSPSPPPPALPPVHATGHRTSSYRGVTRHRWTGRYEAHLWDNTCWREGQKRKGRQVYLGGYDKEDKAARAYDLAALKYWGIGATTNFPRENYMREIEEMQNMSRHDVVASLRRKSSGFSRGASIYRGVTRHHQHGRWQARIGRVAGNKDLYLGTFATEEQAAEAYDIAALKFRGENAVTNFEPSRYNLRAIAQADLPITAPGRRPVQKPAPQAEGQASLGAAPASISQQSRNSLPLCFLPNCLQPPPCQLQPQPQAQPLQSSYNYSPGCYNLSFGEPNFYWPNGNMEQRMHLNSKLEIVNGLLQLARSTAN